MTTATLSRKPARKSSAAKTPPPQIENWRELLDIALTVPGSIGSTFSRFHTYSFLNQILLRSQGVNEPCASYDRWQAMGRQVQKVEKVGRGKFINRPIFIKRENSKGEDDTFMKFKLVRGAHPLSHTEGDDLPEYVAPQWDRSRALSELAIRQADFTQLDGNIQGYSWTDKAEGKHYFAMNPVAVDWFSTFIHEVAHIVLGHTSEAPSLTEHRGIQEFQAEAVAFLVMHELEVPEDQWNASEMRAYIQGWLGKIELTDRQITAVFSATDKILRAGLEVSQGEIERMAA